MGKICESWKEKLPESTKDGLKLVQQHELGAEEAGDGFAQEANRVTNEDALDRTLEKWANILVKRLDEAHKATQ